MVKIHEKECRGCNSPKFDAGAPLSSHRPVADRRAQSLHEADADCGVRAGVRRSATLREIRAETDGRLASSCALGRYRDATIKYLTLGLLLVVAACGENRDPSVYEVAGAREQRIAVLTAIFSKRLAPPTPILDAHFVEEHSGDGWLGPSDYRTFYAVVIAPEDVEKWTEALTSLNEAPYAAPSQQRDWWISTEAHASLAFYQPDAFTGSSHGWFGVSAETGRIYIFTFTN